MVRWIKYVLRVFRWWLRCLWEGQIVPRKLPGAPFARSYMRRVWRERLRELDRAFNLTRDRRLLGFRRVMVSKRRRCLFE